MGWFDDLKDLASDYGHTALDVVGMVPVIGNLADLGNAIWYASEGDEEMAALSLAAAIPGAGLAVGGGKLALGAGKAVKTAETATQAAKQTSKAAKKALPQAKKAAQTAATKAKQAGDAVDAAKKSLAAARKLPAGSGGRAAKILAAQRSLKSKKQLLKQASKASRKLANAQKKAAKTLQGAKASVTGAKAAQKEAADFAAKGGVSRFIGATTTPGMGRIIGGKTFGGKAFNVALGVAGFSPAKRKDEILLEWEGMTPEEQEEYTSKQDYLDEVEAEARVIKKANRQWARFSKARKDKFGNINNYIAHLKGESIEETPKEDPNQTGDSNKTAPPLLDADNETDESKKEEDQTKQPKKSREDRKRLRRRKKRIRNLDVELASKRDRTARREEKKAASAIDEKHDIADNMLDMMGNDPNIFRNNPIEKGKFWKRARAVGVTADQFNNFIKRKYPEAQRIFKEREFERESAEGRAWLNEKLDQPSLNQMGVPTPSARGRNIGRLKTGKVSPTEPEVRESVREFDEDGRKRQRSRDRGRRQIEGRRGRGRRDDLFERFNPPERYRRMRAETPTMKDAGLERERRGDSGLPRGAIGTDSYGNIIFPEGDIRNSQMVVRRMEGPQYLKPRLEEKQRPDNRRRGKRRSRR